MPIVSHVRLVVLRPTEAPADIAARWQTGIKGQAERINLNRQAVIGDETAFQKRVAGVSQKNWPGFVNPGFVSKSGLSAEGIIISRKDNLKGAFTKWNRKLNRAFETVDGVPAKRFKEAVDEAVSDFSKGIAKRTLPFTGDKVHEGRGPAVIAGLWLTGDAAVEEYLRGGDSVMEGGPYRICRAQAVPAFRAALNQRIIQSGSNLIKANFNGGIISTENDETNHLVQSLINPALGLVPFATGGLSHCDFVLEHGELYLDIEVNQI